MRFEGLGALAGVVAFAIFCLMAAGVNALPRAQAAVETLLSAL